MDGVGNEHGDILQLQGSKDISMNIFIQRHTSGSLEENPRPVDIDLIVSDTLQVD